MKTSELIKIRDSALQIGRRIFNTRRLIDPMAEGQESPEWHHLDWVSKNAKPTEANITTVTVDDEAKPKDVILSLHLRPPLVTVDPKNELPNGKDTGLSIEASAAVAIRENESAKAAAKRVAKTAISNSKVELIPGTKNLSHDPGAFVSRVARFINPIKESEIKCDGEVKDTQLAALAVPLKDALNYLYKLADQGLSVSAQAIFGVLDAMKQYKIPVKFGQDVSNVKPKILWSVNEKVEPKEQTPFHRLANQILEKFPKKDVFGIAA